MLSVSYGTHGGLVSRAAGSNVGAAGLLDRDRQNPMKMISTCHLASTEWLNARHREAVQSRNERVTVSRRRAAGLLLAVTALGGGDVGSTAGKGKSHGGGSQDDDDLGEHFAGGFGRLKRM